MTAKAKRRKPKFKVGDKVLFGSRVEVISRVVLRPDGCCYVLESELPFAAYSEELLKPYSKSAEDLARAAKAGR